MLLCHCQVVSDRDVRAAVAAGARDVCEVARACGAGLRCGGCLPVVRELLAAAGHETHDDLDARDIRRVLTVSDEPAA